jgi:parallel beta-helix repeat protein
MAKNRDHRRLILGLISGFLFILFCFQFLPTEAMAQTGISRSYFLNSLISRSGARLRAAFVYDPIYPIPGQAVQFTDASSGSPTSWQWDFSDGTTSVVQNPTHAFAARGFYRVALTIGNDSGSRTMRRMITVVAGSSLRASFAFSPGYPGLGQEVQFTDTSTGSPASWQWDFGDGRTSTVRNPRHAFTARGFYRVSLTINDGSSSKTVLRTVTIASAAELAASFSYSPVSPAAGQEVQFTDTSTGSPTSWQWSFGDGGTSTAQNPSHSYTTAGPKTVTLTIVSSSGSNTAIQSISVTSSLAAAFTYSPASPMAGQTVQFTDTSTGNPTSWQWNFGDGGTSTAQNPSHVFATAGARTVALIAINASGSNSTTRTVTVGAPLAASFTYSPASPAAGQTVQFTDTSAGNPTSWQWNFGDGGTSTAQNPSHVFATAGSKTVALTATNSSGSETATQTITVVPAVVASFTYSPASPAAGQSVRFTDTSTGSPTSRQWNFGDGGSSTSRNPSHTFATAGSKTVTLTVTNSSGSDTATQTITVAPALVASFTYSPASPAAGQSVAFTDTSTGSPSIWQWDFGDGATSQAQNPSHIFTAAGSFNVTLTIMNASGQASVNLTVTVSPVDTLTASFTYSPASPAAGQSVAFTDRSTGSPTSRQWNFGDGGTSTSRNPSHTFTTAGSKTVTLTVTSSTGSINTSRTVTVIASLVAAFDYNPAAPASGQIVQFTDTSSGDSTSWSWNFNDGATSTDQNPSHVFATAGSYTVTLVVINASLSSSVTRVVVVVPSSVLTASFTYSPSSPVVDQAVQFTDTSTGDPVSWSWDFGDGVTSTYQNPSHTFASAGAYTVTLVASTTLGSSSTNQIVSVSSTSSSIIPADRIIDWSYAGIPGGIPTRSMIYATLTPSSTLAQINSAISSCPAGQVVYFEAGTYNISGKINLGSKKQVTIRGAGPGVTILNATGSATVIGTTNTGFNYTGGSALANDAGLRKGSTSVTVAGSGALPSSFAVGNLMLIDQIDDQVLVFVRTGNWAGTRNLRHVTRITGVAGRVVSFATPIPYSFSYAQNPQASVISATASLCGVENMTIHAANDGDCMEFYGADRCWLSKVELTNWGNEGVLFRDSAQCEVRRCYIHTCRNFPNEAEGYGIYTWYGTSNFLIEDNIMYQCSYGILASGSSSNAIMYNYVWHMGRDAASRFWEQPGFSCNHGPHGIMNLYEGNFMERWQNDGYHGNSSYQTLFRNNIHGVNPAYTLDRRVVDLCKGSYYHTIVGNVIGASSWAPNYYNAPGTGLDRAKGYIYVLGYPNMGSGSLSPETTFTGYPYGYPDEHVAATLLRHGNYDYFNKSTVWDSAISGRSIPASLRYSSKPSWFGSMDWPAVGPDVTGLVKDIPAKWRWNRFQASGNMADLFADSQ